MSTNLENAHIIARAASCIDDLKNSPHISDLMRAEAKQHAENLHDIATELAGDRMNEVYAPDDSLYSSSEEICKFFDRSLSVVEAAALCVINTQAEPSCANT